MKKKAFIIKQVIFIIISVVFTFIIVNIVRDINKLYASFNATGAEGYEHTLKALKLIAFGWAVIYLTIISINEYAFRFRLLTIQNNKLHKIIKMLLLVKVLISIGLIVLIFTTAPILTFHQYVYIVIAVYFIIYIGISCFLNSKCNRIKVVNENTD